MRLELANFRCYNGQHKLDLGAGKVTLLQGDSGAGKSTLFCAIEWCLFGRASLIKRPNGEDEKETKTRARSKKAVENNACWVALAWDASERADGKELFIKRLRGIGKIFLQHGTDIDIEGDPAQAYIVRLFGTETLWKASSYIRQRERCALLEINKKSEILAELGYLAYGHATACDAIGCLTPDQAKTRIDSFSDSARKNATRASIELGKAETILTHFNANNSDLVEVDGPVISESELKQMHSELELMERSVQEGNALIPWIQQAKSRIEVATKTLMELPNPLPSEEDIGRARKINMLLGQWTREKAKVDAARLPPAPGPEPPAGPFTTQVQRPPQPSTLGWTESDAMMVDARNRERQWLSGCEYTRDAVDRLVKDMIRETHRRADVDALNRLRTQVPLEAERKQQLEGILSLNDKCAAVHAQWSRSWIELARRTEYNSAWPDRELINRVLGSRRVTVHDKNAILPRLRDDTAIRTRIDTCRNWGLPITSEKCALNRIAEIDQFVNIVRRVEKDQALSRELARMSYATQYALDELLEQREALMTKLANADREASFRRVECPCCLRALRWTGLVLVRYEADQDALNEDADSVREQLCRLDSDIERLRADVKTCQRLTSERIALGLDRVDPEYVNQARSITAEDMENISRERADMVIVGSFPPGWPSFDADPDETELQDAIALCDTLARSTTELCWLLAWDDLRKPVLSQEELTAFKKEYQQLCARAQELALREERHVPDQDIRFISMSDEELSQAIETAKGIRVLPLPRGATEITTSDDIRAQILRDSASRDEWEKACRTCMDREAEGRRAQSARTEWERARNIYEKARTELEADQQCLALTTRAIQELGEDPHQIELSRWSNFVSVLEKARAAEQSASKEKYDAEQKLNELMARFNATPSQSELEILRSKYDEAVKSLNNYRRLEQRRALQRDFDARAEESKRAEIQVEQTKALKKLAETLETRLLDQIVSDLNASLEVICEPLFEEPATVYITLTKQNATNDGVRTSFDVHLLRGDLDLLVTDASGGEGDRVSFALALALADLPLLKGSPLLLLDESMGALNDTLREAGVETLKNFVALRSYKTVACIDHEVVRGMYDDVIWVDKEHHCIYPMVNGEIVKN